MTESPDEQIETLQIEIEVLTNRLAIFERDAARWAYVENNTEKVLEKYRGNLGDPSFREVVDAMRK